MQHPRDEWLKRLLFLQVPVLLWLILKLAAIPANAVQVTLGDVTQIQGLRENQIIGYGLVVGLQGTGDSRQSLLTAKSMANMLEKFGLNLSSRDFYIRNCAAVMVTATMLPFTREGNKIDVNVASIGDAKSLQGGTLLMTPLLAGNQKVYAQAQGPISVGGYYVATRKQSIRKNITTAGVIPNGGIIEKTVDCEFLKDNRFNLVLERTDFILADQIVRLLVGKFGLGVARTRNGTDIEIVIPQTHQPNPVSFIAEAMVLPVQHNDKARIVIDERTGTIVVGGEIRIAKVAVSHGGLHIAISGDVKISQPMPFSLGHTVVAEDLAIRVDEAQGEMVIMPEGTTIEELVRALNALGTLPRDIIVIVENLKAIGALHAQVITR